MTDVEASEAQLSTYETGVTPSGYEWEVVVGKSNNFYVDFKSWKTIGTTADGAKLYQADSFGGVEDRAKADVFASGFIKWDGCINLQFDEQDKVMLHFCGKKMILDALSELFAALYEAADRIMSKTTD